MVSLRACPVDNERLFVRYSFDIMKQHKGAKTNEESTYRYGDQLIHIGCQEDCRVYIYANNMRKVSE